MIWSLGHHNYTYGSNGNLTSDGTRNFAYNDKNRLVAVWIINSRSNSFAYDGLLRKRIEQDFTWGGGSWVGTNEVHYIYDLNRVLQVKEALAQAKLWPDIQPDYQILGEPPDFNCFTFANMIFDSP